MNKNTNIKRIHGRQIFDSRGRPTVEADIELVNGVRGRAAVPSGASTGIHESVELRDRDPNEFEGLGVRRAVGHINTRIAPLLQGRDVFDQRELDATMRALDGSTNLSVLGANAVLAVSLAISRAAANTQQMPLHRYIASSFPGRTPSLPMPMVNILSGGAHAGRGMDLQDFLLVPIGANSYQEAMAMIMAVRSASSALMARAGLSVLLADEGGLSPGFPDAHQALELMVQSMEQAKLRPGIDAAIALDVAATQLLEADHYRLARTDRRLSSNEMAIYIADLAAQYPIVSIEDPLGQDDWTGWRHFTEISPKIQIVGDDLFVTNSERIQRGISSNVANAALIKINQNGTLTGTLDAMRTAWQGNYRTVVSARSGETEDDFIADLAVGSGAGQIKVGSVRTSERMAKYNQLLRIEEEIDAEFANPFRATQ